MLEVASVERARPCQAQISIRMILSIAVGVLVDTERLEAQHV